MTHRIEFCGMDITSMVSALAVLPRYPVGTTAPVVVLSDEAQAVLLALGWQPPAAVRDCDSEGWFAREDDEAEDERYRWQPRLQGAGMQDPVETWFATEADCLTYIAERILGRGLLYLDEMLAPATGPET
ncbi:hypothetical protein ACU686_44780 [Yinghuangia aomiensis]